MRASTRRWPFALCALTLLVPLAGLSAGEKDKGRAKDRAEIEKTAVEFGAAFEKGDAKTVASFWTEDGEYNDNSGEKFRGRAAIEKAFAEFFKTNKGAKINTKIDGIRFPSKATAIEDGTITVTLSDKKKNVTKYSVLHVREEGAWRMAVVREWEDDDDTPTVKVKDLEWLIGTWTGKTPEGQVEMRYSWNESKTFIKGVFTVKAKEVPSGMQVIGRDPVDDVLRSWVFGEDGSIGQGVWFNDGSRWTVQALSKTLDGGILTSTNLINRVSDDAFSWQSVNRRLNGEVLPDTVPVKLTRVKSK
ncbi:MAG: SgcJ/EcaC family oxidoreductase [Gemmataceae bacterium]